MSKFFKWPPALNNKALEDMQLDSLHKSSCERKLMIESVCLPFITINAFSIMINDWNCWSCLTIKKLDQFLMLYRISSCDNLHTWLFCTMVLGYNLLLHNCLYLALTLELFLNFRHMKLHFQITFQHYPRQLPFFWAKLLRNMNMLWSFIFTLIQPVANYIWNICCSIIPINVLSQSCQAWSEMLLTKSKSILISSQ